MVDRVLVSRHMVDTVILLTAPPPGRFAPGPAACSNFHRYSPAPPVTDTPPSPGYRYHTGRSSSSSGQTSLGRAPRGAAEPPLPPRRSCKRSRITPLKKPPSPPVPVQSPYNPPPARPRAPPSTPGSGRHRTGRGARAGGRSPPWRCRSRSRPPRTAGHFSRRSA